MKVPISWLKAFVPFETTPAEFAQRMTMTGSKVEAVEVTGEEIQNVVVGHVLSVEKHPDADKLVVCQVNVGEETIQIVTGADNVTPGVDVPVALNGSKLPGGISIKKGKLRGVVSNGMMCSIEELGLLREDYPGAPEHGILLLEGEPAPGTDIKQVLGMGEEIVEFEITSNRPDCLSVIGLAREAAVTYDKPLTVPPITVTEAGGDAKDEISVTIEAPEKCFRYVARVVKDVKIAPSPKWMRDRLSACGVRPINNIVDITNYVMLEMGQPMHAFDINDVAGRQIIVRTAKEGETITTLDGEAHELTTDMLMICDSEKPTAVAGVMGGLNSEIKDDTTTLLFESAVFDGGSVRRTAKKLGLRTEASSRYEKGLDPNMALAAINRAVELVHELGAGKVVSGVVDVYPNPKEAVKLPLRADKINAFLGTDIPKETMIDILKKLDFKVENDVITAPTYRVDIECEADIAEEIVRIYGYDEIPETVLDGETTIGAKNEKQKLEDTLNEILTASGLYEIYTYSFVSPKSLDMIRLPEDAKEREMVQILNPLGEENSVMRTTTIPSMLEALARNYSRRVQSAGLFEIGMVYEPKSLPVTELPVEKQKVTLGMYQKGDFYALKGIVENLLSCLGISGAEFEPLTDHPAFHPGRAATLLLNGASIGVLGEIHPEVAENYEIDERVLVAEIDFNALFENENPVSDYRPLPKYPAVSRDIAVLVKEDTLVREIEKRIEKCAGKLLEEVKLFDIYQGKQVPEGMKSVAYAITFRAADRTLTDEEISGIMDKMVKKLSDELGASLR